MAEARRIRIFKDPVSSSTHFAGFLAALVGAFYLLLHAGTDPAKVASLGIYGASLVLLFLASSCYHFFDIGARGNQWLRRLDHSAVFLLIAGTYVPVLVHTLEGSWRVAMLLSVLGLTAAGLIFKLVWLEAPRWLSTVSYVALGWFVLIPAADIFPNLPAGSAAWLVGGGVAFMLGALIYGTKRPDPWPERFGFHEIWHVFVLAGAGAHFVFTWRFLDAQCPPF